jgi:hypothetical protein
MTEAEAYDMLEWPRAGAWGTFILPVSGSDRTDWRVYECPNVGCCGYRGLTLPEAVRDARFMAVCPQCNTPWVWREE